MNVFNIFIVIAVIAMEANCQNYQKYYFSSFDSDLPRVYEYSCKTDLSRSQYWRITTKDDDLITEAFDANYIQLECIIEKIDDQGANLVSYINFDSEGDTLRRDVQKTAVYRWKENGPYEYSIEYDNNDERIFFIKEREYVGSTEVNIQGNNYKCLKFLGTYKFGLAGQGVEYEYYQYSYYAKGIGMVRYERFFPDGESIILELTRIYDDNEWYEKIK